MCVCCSHCENKKLCPGRVTRETHKQLETNTNGTGAGWQILAVKKALSNPRARIQLRNNTNGTRAGWPAWAVKRGFSNLRDTQSIGNQHKQHPSGVTKVGCDESLSATRGTHKPLETNTNGTWAGWQRLVLKTTFSNPQDAKTIENNTNAPGRVTNVVCKERF